MSAPWLTGGRLSSRIVERHLAAALMRGAHEEAMARAASRCVRVWRAAGETLGPASGAGAVWAHLVRPCADALGWAPGDAREQVVARLRMRTATATFGTTRQVLVALPWGTSQDGLQRAVIRLAADEMAPWVSVCNGVSWRWYDATRPYARDHLGVELAHATVDARVWHALWLFGQAAPAWPCTRHGPARAGIEQLDRRQRVGGGRHRRLVARRRGSGTRGALGPRARDPRRARDPDLPVAVPPVRGGTRPAAGVASRVPPQLRALGDGSREPAPRVASDGCSRESRGPGARGTRGRGPRRGACRRTQRPTVCRHATHPSWHTTARRGAGPDARTNDARRGHHGQKRPGRSTSPRSACSTSARCTST